MAPDHGPFPRFGLLVGRFHVRLRPCPRLCLSIPALPCLREEELSVVAELWMLDAGQ